MIKTIIIMMPTTENYDSRDMILECPKCFSRDVFTCNKKKKGCCRLCWHKDWIENFER